MCIVLEISFRNLKHLPLEGMMFAVIHIELVERMSIVKSGGVRALMH